MNIDELIKDYEECTDPKMRRSFEKKVLEELGNTLYVKDIFGYFCGNDFEKDILKKCEFLVTTEPTPEFKEDWPDFLGDKIYRLSNGYYMVSTVFGEGEKKEGYLERQKKENINKLYQEWYTATEACTRAFNENPRDWHRADLHRQVCEKELWEALDYKLYPLPDDCYLVPTNTRQVEIRECIKREDY